MNITAIEQAFVAAGYVVQWIDTDGVSHAPRDTPWRDARGDHVMAPGCESDRPEMGEHIEWYNLRKRLRPAGTPITCLWCVARGQASGE